MRAEPIRNALREEPFHPFRLRTASGAEHIIPHPEFAALSPKGRSLVIFDEQDSPCVLDLGLIESIERIAAGGGNGQDAG